MTPQSAPYTSKDWLISRFPEDITQKQRKPDWWVDHLIAVVLIILIGVIVWHR